jgi:flagellin
MKINRNMSAVITNRQLLRTENKLTASMERLSSGYKINRAGDNPAGIAISSKMKAQIDGLDQAESNASDGQSALNIADGALNEISSMLQRMRELSVQAANDTNTISERESIQEEIDQLRDEVDRISTDTEYNTKTLLDGSSDVRVYSKQVERMDISDTVISGNYKFSVDKIAEKAEYTLHRPEAADDDVDGSIVINDVTVDYTAGMTENDFFEALRTAAEQGGCVASQIEDADGNVTGYKITTKEYGSGEQLKIEMSKELAEKISGENDTFDAEAEVSEDGETYTLNRYGKDAEITLERNTDPDSDSNFSRSATYSASGTRIKITDNGGFSMDLMLKNNSLQSVDIEVTDIGAMTIQLGANQYQEMDVRIPEISSKSLYLDKVDVTVTGGADKALNTLDDAISKLNDVRSRIGAYTNRLEYAVNSLAESQEDMTTAYSNIMDTDMAEEMTEYTQQSVLEQASISVLSQANDLPQQVLSLLQ